MKAFNRTPGPRCSRRAVVAAVLPLAFASAACAQVLLPPLPPAAPQPPPPPPEPIPPLSRAQIGIAVRALASAESHGLATMAVQPDAPQEQIKAALLRYAHDVHVGRLELADFPSDWGVRPPPYDPRPELIAAITTDRLGPWLDSLPPPYAGYTALRRGLAAYRQIAAAGGWKPVPAGPAFTMGQRDARVAALRARLAAEDPGVSTTGPAVFGDELLHAVARAQARFGLKPDGVVDAGTLAALNQPVGQRILQIIANLERWRWLPPQMPPTRVQVNSGAAIVTLFKDDRPVLSMRAVSGKPGDETPMLFSKISSVVLNPPWNVPTTIAERELWPKEEKSPGYFAHNDFVVIPTDDGGRRIQQKAGPKSALGRYKFDFDNPYGVYLHDTPTQSTFSRYGRQASHGCVRLEKPRDLAEALLAGDPQWTPEAIAAAVAKGDTVRARLPLATPVFIFYWTAFAGPAGEMNFRTDTYNWDRLLLERIGVVGGVQA